MDEVDRAEKLIQEWNEHPEDHRLVYSNEPSGSSQSFIYEAGAYLVHHIASLDTKGKKVKFIEGIIVLLKEEKPILVDRIVSYHPFDEQEIDFCVNIDTLCGLVLSHKQSIGDALNNSMFEFMKKFKSEPDRVASRLKSTHSGKVRGLPWGTVVSGGLPTLGKRR